MSVRLANKSVDSFSSFCAEWGTRLIEALSYLTCKRQEGSYGGVVGTEAMLAGCERKFVKFRLQKAFKDLNSRAKE